jgi:hypothetical protein
MNDGSTTQNANSAQSLFATTPVGGGIGNPSIRYGSGIIAGADSLANNRYLNAGLMPTVQQVSVSAWVNPAARVQWAKIICKSWDSYNLPFQVFSLQVPSPDTAIQFHVGLSSQFSGYTTSKDSLASNTWTHVAGTYDGFTIRLYVNGAPAGSFTWLNGPVPAVPSVQSSWTIGGWDLRAAESFGGKIDEPRIFRGVWGPDYIKLSYENQRIGSALLQFK